jgi:hypothetical protein
MLIPLTPVNSELERDRFNEGWARWRERDKHMLQFVWFSHGATVPTVLYDNSVGLLDDLTFRCHAGCQAIHVRRDGKFIGLIWPSRIYAPDVVTNAHKQLNARGRSRKKS